ELGGLLDELGPGPGGLVLRPFPGGAGRLHPRAGPLELPLRPDGAVVGGTELAFHTRGVACTLGPGALPEGGGGGDLRTGGRHLGSEPLGPGLQHGEALTSVCLAGTRPEELGPLLGPRSAGGSGAPPAG